MKDFWLLMILFSFMGSLIFAPMGFDTSGYANIQSGLDNPGIGNGHLGVSNGKGHTNYQGNGWGHVKHGSPCGSCSNSSPNCTCEPPCVPPCGGSGL